VLLKGALNRHAALGTLNDRINVAGDERQNGSGVRNLTSDSTGAGIARLSFVSLDACFIVSCPVNRSVRRLVE